MKYRLAAAALLATLAASAGAAPIYRCGPDGKTFSQVPCAEGKVVESSDPRSAAQRKEAQRMAERERDNAARMERERLAAEKVAAKDNKTAAGPARIDGRPAPAASAPAERKDFVAVEPKPAKK